MRHKSRGSRVVVAQAWGLLLTVASAVAEPASTQPQAPLTAADWRADLEFAHAEIPRRHVAPWHTLDQPAYEAAFERLLSDSDALAEHEVIVRLAEIVASLGDGHSRLSLPMDAGAAAQASHTGTAVARARAFHRLPLQLTWTPEGYVVTAAAPALERLLGLLVVAIDGHRVADVESALSPIVNRDNEHQLHDLLPWFMAVPEVLHARGITASTGTSHWRFTDGSGTSLEATLSPIPAGQAVQWRHVPAADWPAGRAQRDEALWFTDIDDPRAVFVRVAEIADAPRMSFAGFASELQAHLARTDRRKLIVDLRGNPGGDNTLNASLLRALIRTPWVSEPGALLVLIDGGTFSAAMNLVEDLEQWLPTVFVGSGTGARPNSYGDARKFQLPRSGLTLRLSSLYWQNHPQDGRTAIDPLIPAMPTVMDVRSGSDPALRALRGLESPATAVAGRWQGQLSASFRQLPMTIELPDRDSHQGTVRIPDLGVDTAGLQITARDGPIWRGVLQLRNGPVPMAVHASSGRLVGWIDYRGNCYPFVLAGP